MKFLLDTHTLIWFLENNPKLSEKSRLLIENIDNEVFVSVTSWFEISVKLTIGKLTLPDSLPETIAKSTSNQILTIGISDFHLITYQELPLTGNHRDPFDRLIIATAIFENYTLISADPMFSLYSDHVEIIW
ncbi:type II toxin-antitoxin system VapC family toxin [Dyadobacter bucti]|uniref:type II toxin-antitoxin system VapC family toxin n=1 Tax=Dyadobacter bucti TaxID=2572203 RepID=UPI003F71F58E